MLMQPMQKEIAVRLASYCRFQSRKETRKREFRLFINPY